MTSDTTPATTPGARPAAGTATDPACAVAHGDRPPDAGPRSLVAVFESPVAEYLLRLGIEVGYRTTLVEPDPSRLTGRVRPHGDRLAVALDPSIVDKHTDVIVTDHDRPELGAALRDALRLPARWIGVIGSVRHTAPHLAALRDLGVADDDVARVHRPVGLNIGSRSPAEIALATLAGLIADRNHRPGGFAF
jgi:xanthine/CO dehydrogenase XdhC/CoxF family maturation factor